MAGAWVIAGGGPSVVSSCAGVGSYEGKQSPFLLFGLPRSRTAWFSTMLSLGKRTCYHELEADCLSFDEFSKGLNGAGNSSTAAWRMLPKILARYPKARFVWLDRDSEGCAASNSVLGFPWFDEYQCDEMKRDARNIGAMSQLVVSVNTLTLATCRKVWEHLIPDESFPTAKVQNLLRMNVRLTDSEFQKVVSTQTPWILEMVRQPIAK